MRLLLLYWQLAVLLEFIQYRNYRLEEISELEDFIFFHILLFVGVLSLCVHLNL